MLSSEHLGSNIRALPQMDRHCHSHRSCAWPPQRAASTPSRCACFCCLCSLLQGACSSSGTPAAGSPAAASAGCLLQGRPVRPATQSRIVQTSSPLYLIMPWPRLTCATATAVFCKGNGTVGRWPWTDKQLGISKSAASSDLSAGGAHLASKSLHRLQARDHHVQYLAKLLRK